MIDKLRQIRFFEKTFLFADTCIKMVPKMFFFLLSYINVNFERITRELI